MKKNQIILSIYPFIGSFFYGLHVYTLNRRNFSKVFVSWFISIIFAILMILLSTTLPSKLMNNPNVFIIYIIITGILFNIIFCLIYNNFERREKKHEFRNKSIRNRTRS